jgi:hypothetical protein
MHYRVYWLDNDDKIRGVRNLLECSSDEHAMRLAAVWLEAWPIVEVWQGQARIAKFDAAQFRASGSAVSAFWQYSAEHWRERAEEARVIAEGTHDGTAKEALLRAAEVADRIATKGASYAGS